MFCPEVLIYKRLQMWRHNDVIGHNHNEYLISAWSKSTIPWYIHCNFCLNLHITHGDMEEKVSGCFFFWTLCIYLTPVTQNESCSTAGADPFGGATLLRPWDDHSNSLENAKTRMRAAFEFMSKLGIRHYTFHDVYVNFTSFSTANWFTTVLA